MCKINIAGSGHVAPLSSAGGDQWLAFTPKEHEFKRTLERALHILTTQVKNYTACNAAFAKLPGGRTFQQVLEDNSVWISFDPSTANGNYATTSGSDVSLTAYALGMGHWTAAATLVHELAHVNGAPGGKSHQAEHCLVHCRLTQLHHRDIVGRPLQALGKTRVV